MLLYYVTDRRAFAGSHQQQVRELLSRMASAAAAGVNYIQLREKDLPARELECVARETVAAVRAGGSSTRLLINGRTDVALACEADGVHVPGNDLPASEVRTLWMRASDRTPVIGVSAHTVNDVRYAEAHGADFAVLAPIFEKPGSDLTGLGLDSLSVACRGPQPPDNTESAPKSSFPVLALGGVNLGNAESCIRAGAAGVAGIRLFQTGNIGETVSVLRRIGARANATSTRRA